MSESARCPQGWLFWTTTCVLAVVVGIGVHRLSRPTAQSEVIPLAAVASMVAPKSPTTCSDHHDVLPPDYKPPASTTSMVGTIVDRRLPFDKRIDPLLGQKLVAVDDPQDRAALHTVLRDAGDEDTIRHEVANLLRGIEDPRVEESLLSVLANPDDHERFKFFAAQHLGEIYRGALEKKTGSNLATAERLRGKLREFMVTDRHAYVRRQALLSLCQTQDEVGLAEARRIISREPDTHPAMDVACRIIGEQKIAACYPDLRRMSCSSVEIVRQRAMAQLGTLKDEASRPVFEAAAVSKNKQEQAIGQAALRQLGPAAAAPDVPPGKAAP